MTEIIQDHMAWTVVKYLAVKLQELEDGMKQSGPAARADFQTQLDTAEKDIKQLEEQEKEVV